MQLWIGARKSVKLTWWRNCYPYRPGMISLLLSLLILSACDKEKNDTSDMPDISTSDSLLAEVIQVTVSGAEGNYQFSVTIQSPDLGCEQYANWWEVVTPDGALLYRRVLGHSHVNEQPFTRSGGPVKIKSQDSVFVRAHMHPHGYGRKAMTGTIRNGWQEIQVDTSFASVLATQDPLPGPCPF